MQRLPSLSRRQGYSKPAGENHNRAPKTGVSSRPATATSDHRPLGSRWLGSVSPRRRRPISLAFATRFANSSARSRDSPSVPSRDRNAEIGQYGRSSGSPFSHGQQRRSLSVEGCTPHDRGPRVRIPFAPAASLRTLVPLDENRRSNDGRSRRDAHDRHDPGTAMLHPLSRRGLASGARAALGSGEHPSHDWRVATATALVGVRAGQRVSAWRSACP